MNIGGIPLIRFSTDASLPPEPLDGDAALEDFEYLVPQAR
jgi:hypothetical protein